MLTHGLGVGVDDVGHVTGSKLLPLHLAHAAIAALVMRSSDVEPVSLRTVCTGMRQRRLAVSPAPLAPTLQRLCARASGSRHHVAARSLS